MSDADLVPDLVRIIQELEARVSALESGDAPSGATNINDLEDVSVNVLTRANLDRLTWSESLQAWVNAAGSDASFPLIYNDGNNTFTIEADPTLFIFQNDDDSTVAFGNLVFNVSGSDSVTTLESKGVNGDAYVQVGGYANDGLVLLNVDDGASHPGSVSVESDGTDVRFDINVLATVFKRQIAPLASSSLAGSQFTIWLDPTPGLTTFNVKAKDSGGTVRTASIPLT